MKKILLSLLLAGIIVNYCQAQNTDLPFGINLAGAEFAHNKIPGVYNQDYGYPTVAELDYFKSKGLALIRLPFLWERIQPRLNGALDPTELGRMKSFVDAAKERNLLIILDMHNYCRRYENGTRHIIGSKEVSIDHVADAWARLASEFKGYTNIWGYGLMNEPHDLLESAPWFEIAQAMINRVRTIDTKTPIIVAGDSWSSAERWPFMSGDLKHLKDPSNNLIFEGHIYFDEDASGSYKNSYEAEKASPETGITRAIPFVNWLKENNLKGFIGEYGIPDNDPRWMVTLDKFLAYLKSNGIYGTYWAAGPRWGNYVLAVQPRNGQDRPQMEVLEKYKFADNSKR